MKLPVVIVSLLLIGFIVITGFSSNNKSYTPDKGFVPDEETAIKIAEAIWLPIYGNSINNKKPFKATLQGDSLWVVEGTLGDQLGGVPYIEIMKADCRVLNVTHGK